MRSQSARNSIGISSWQPGRPLNQSEHAHGARQLLAPGV